MNPAAQPRARWNGKRYNSFNRVLREAFGCRVYKVSLRADFTCPNRDGRVATGGCIYCNNAGHTPLSYEPALSIREQMERGIEAVRRRHRADKFIAYFQSYTNTYGPLTKLERLYREALALPDVVGLAVGTRPDCVPDDVLDLIAAIARDAYVWLELGLESTQERTLRWVNRGHGLAEFVDAVARSKRRGLRVCAHLILGFPGETREEILATPAFLNALEIDGVKLHNLHVIRNTVLERLYRAGGLPLLSRDEYVALVVDFLERLRPETIVHRLTGETYRELTVAPEWSINKMGLFNAIEKELAARDSWQGKNYRPGSLAASPPLDVLEERAT
ncbi:MAG TPA: TIGR01212 family radical SAM protein [Candidatus Acidoferrales bacterium]|nr:TIGR01212 family radical SAM protein [Candidatus Acidoferrales bacterium]